MWIFLSMFKIECPKVSFGYVKTPLVYTKYEKDHLTMWRHPWLGQKWRICCEICLDDVKVTLAMSTHAWMGQKWIFVFMFKLGSQNTPFGYVKWPMVRRKIEKVCLGMSKHPWLDQKSSLFSKNVPQCTKSAFDYVQTCMDGWNLWCYFNLETWPPKHPIRLCPNTLGWP